MGIVRRVPLAFVGLVVAPIAGVWGGSSMPNPPGNGPGAGQVVVGVAVPAVVTFGIAAIARIRPSEAIVWTVASLAGTGGLVVFLSWFVQTHIRT